MKEALKDIKAIALQMEIDGIKFYKDLADKTLHPFGKAMFKSFVEDEKLHAKRLRILLSADEKEKQAEAEVGEVSARERLTSVFQSLAEELKKKVGVNTNDIEAVKLAIEIEENGAKFYEQAAKDTVDAKNRETYHFLADEERTHLGILKNTLEYLENKDQWEAENEGRVYDLWMGIVNKK